MDKCRRRVWPTRARPVIGEWAVRCQQVCIPEPKLKAGNRTNRTPTTFVKYPNTGSLFEYSNLCAGASKSGCPYRGTIRVYSRSRVWPISLVFLAFVGTNITSTSGNYYSPWKRKINCACLDIDLAMMYLIDHNLQFKIPNRLSLAALADGSFCGFNGRNIEDRFTMTQLNSR